jgi:hypothetical protein
MDIMPISITFYTKPRIAIVDKMNLTAAVTDTDVARVSRELRIWPEKTLLCLKYPDKSLTIFVSPPPDKIRSIGGVVDITGVPGYVIEVRHEGQKSCIIEKADYSDGVVLQDHLDAVQVFAGPWELERYFKNSGLAYYPDVKRFIDELLDSLSPPPSERSILKVQKADDQMRKKREARRKAAAPAGEDDETAGTGHNRDGGEGKRIPRSPAYSIDWTVQRGRPVPPLGPLYYPAAYVRQMLAKTGKSQPGEVAAGETRIKSPHAVRTEAEAKPILAEAARSEIPIVEAGQADASRSQVPVASLPGYARETRAGGAIKGKPVAREISYQTKGQGKESEAGAREALKTYVLGRYGDLYGVSPNELVYDLKRRSCPISGQFRGISVARLFRELRAEEYLTWAK